MIAITQEQWSCSAPSTHTKAGAASAPAWTTAPAAPAAQTPASLKLNDPYPTWPFTRVNPDDLARWCKANLPKGQWPQADIEDALL